MNQRSLHERREYEAAVLEIRQLRALLHEACELLEENGLIPEMSKPLSRRAYDYARGRGLVGLRPGRSTLADYVPSHLRPVVSEVFSDTASHFAGLSVIEDPTMPKDEVILAGHGCAVRWKAGRPGFDKVTVDKGTGELRVEHLEGRTNEGS